MILRRILMVAGLTLALPGLALADDVSFTLSNQTGSELTEFYASPVGSDNWEENILAGGALAAGSEGQVQIAGASGCDYDLRMVFADGDVVEDSSNICDTATYTIQ